MTDYHFATFNFGLDEWLNQNANYPTAYDPERGRTSPNTPIAEDNMVLGQRHLERFNFPMFTVKVPHFGSTSCLDQ